MAGSEIRTRDLKVTSPTLYHQITYTYQDRGNGHHQRTSSQQFYDLLYNKFTIDGQKFALIGKVHK